MPNNMTVTLGNLSYRDIMGEEKDFYNYKPMGYSKGSSSVADTYNGDRVIEIFNTTTPTQTWKSNLSTLLNKSNMSTNTDTFIRDETLKGKLDVNKNVHLLMDSHPKVLKTNNEFGKPVAQFLEGKLGGFDNLLTEVATAGSALRNGIAKDTSDLSKTWQPWGKDVIAWKGARGGISFQYEFKFALGQYGIWNAKEEVVLPVLNLIAPALPRHIGTFTMTGPFPNIYNLLTNMFKEGFSDIKSGVISEIAQSENISDALNKTCEKINDLLLSSYEKFSYTVKFGNIMTFDRMIIENAEVDFSNQVDQYGYPVKGSAKLTFSGMVPLALSADRSNGSNEASLMTYRFGRG